MSAFIYTFAQPPSSSNADPNGPFDPLSSFITYLAAGSAGNISRLYTRELFIRTLCSMGYADLFVGPGPDPTVLANYSANGIWLQQGQGVQAQPGQILIWNRVNPANSAANWVPIDFTGRRKQLQLGASQTFVQASPATVWTITHNYGQYPIIQTFNTAMTAQVTGAISHPSMNQALVTFGLATAGNAIVSIAAPSIVATAVPAAPPALI